MAQPVVITWQHMIDDSNPDAPEMWRYTGAPSILIIDRDNLDHLRYVEPWAHDITDDRVPRSAFGYDYGYYPVDVDDWQMIPDGPYCAACIDPANGYGNPNTRAEEEYPQAYHAELIQEGDQDDTGEWIPRCCIGCNEPLYDPNDN